MDQPVRITPSMQIMNAQQKRAVEFEEGMSYFPPVVITIIGTNVIVFIWQLTHGMLKGQLDFISAGALTRELVFQGEVWRLLTCTFLHGDDQHIMGNMLGLYVVGLACERIFGAARMLGIYMISGLTGSLLSCLFLQSFSVGASGAIFGVISSLVVTMFLYQEFYTRRIKKIFYVLGGWMLYSLAAGLMSPLIDNWAHLGGAAGGAIMAYLLIPSRIGRKKFG